MNTDNQIANSQTAKLLEQLGVKKLTAADVIKHHILPVLKDEMWKVIEQGSLSTWKTLKSNSKPGKILDFVVFSKNC